MVKRKVSEQVPESMIPSDVRRGLSSDHNRKSVEQSQLQAKQEDTNQDIEDQQHQTKKKKMYVKSKFSSKKNNFENLKKSPTDGHHQFEEIKELPSHLLNNEQLQKSKLQDKHIGVIYENSFEQSIEASNKDKNSPFVDRYDVPELPQDIRVPKANIGSLNMSQQSPGNKNLIESSH